jgi:hypothetical protein
MPGTPMGTMKLAAIFNVWADWDLMKYSIRSIQDLVDDVIIVASDNSNYREFYPIPYPFKDDVLTFQLWGDSMEVFRVDVINSNPMQSETHKRNFGLDKAREKDCTHFIMMDADEFYDPEQFLKEKQRFIDNPNLQGLVCASQVYVKSPSLTVGLDTTRVPFIHKITPTLKHEFNRSYPFAWEGKAIRIDPTRSLNINSGVEWSNIVMDHYSWVRKDIHRKIRNSTAKANIERTNIAKNFFHLKEGDICELYPGKPLVRVPVKYGLPEFYEDLQSVPSKGNTPADNV